MKKILFVAVTLIALMAAISCNKDNSVMQRTNTDPIPDSIYCDARDFNVIIGDTTYNCFINSEKPEKIAECSNYAVILNVDFLKDYPYQVRYSFYTYNDGAWNPKVIHSPVQDSIDLRVELTQWDSIHLVIESSCDGIQWYAIKDSIYRFSPHNYNHVEIICGKEYFILSDYSSYYRCVDSIGTTFCGGLLRTRIDRQYLVDSRLGKFYSFLKIEYYKREGGSLGLLGTGNTYLTEGIYEEYPIAEPGSYVIKAYTSCNDTDWELLGENIVDL